MMIKILKDIKSISKILVPIFFVVVIIIIVQNYYDRKELLQYKTVLKENRITGVVKSVYTIQRTSSSFIKLENNEKLHFAESSSKEHNEFCDFIQKGDSIYKKGDNDSIFVFRKNALSYFILGKNINDGY